MRRYGRYCRRIWKTELSGQADRVLLRGPRRLGRHLLLEAEPLLARCTVPGPVQPRMVCEDLYSGPDDEDHQEHIEEVLHPDPAGNPRIRERIRRHDGAGIPGDELLDRRERAQSLPDRHRRDQDHEADRKQPKEIEPPVPAQPQMRRGPERFGEPLRHIDDILAQRELFPKAKHGLGRGRCRAWR
jgi:hypothetical protein